MTTWTDIGQAAVPIAGGLATVFRAFRSRTHRLRGEIRSDVELLNELPDGSAGRTALARSIDEQIVRLIEEGRKSRDPMGMMLAAFFLLLAAWAGYYAVQPDDGVSPWWIAVFLFGTLGLVGLATEGAAKTPEQREQEKIARQSKKTKGR